MVNWRIGVFDRNDEITINHFRDKSDSEQKAGTNWLIRPFQLACQKFIIVITLFGFEIKGIAITVTAHFSYSIICSFVQRSL